MQPIRSSILVLITSLAAFGQAPAAKEFEVASIKPAEPIVNSVSVGVHLDGAMLNCRQLSVADYIRYAYNVKHYQISAPNWVASERFDISAKLPPGAKPEDVRDMLKALLADRFKLKFHRESKEFAVYTLTVAKGGPKMKESELDPEAPDTDHSKPAANVTAQGGPNGTSVALGRGAAFSFGNNKFEATKLTMPQLADSLARFMDKPVVDMTDLKGTYDFTLELTGEDYQVMLIRSAIAAGVQLPPQALQLLDRGNNDSLYAGLQKIGLKMENSKAPIDVIVVDSASQTPTEN